MNKPMRKVERQLTLDEAKEIVQKETYGILSTISKDGTPYGIPLSYAYDGEAVYFHCAKGVGHKEENILHCNKVCFTIVGNTETLPNKFSTLYESVVLFGTIQKEENVSYGLHLIADKYAPEFKKEGDAYIEKAKDKVDIFKIQIEDMKGKARKNR